MFAQTVEGLLRALSPLDPALKARFKSLGVDPDSRLLPAYPVEVWLELVKSACEATLPNQPLEIASYQLGRRFMGGYGQTLVGKTMLMALRVIGPRRTLGRMSRNFRTGNNFSETTLSEPSPGKFELWCHPVTYAGWYCGLIEAGLEQAGAQKVSAVLLRRERGGAVFEVTWG